MEFGKLHLGQAVRGNAIDHVEGQEAVVGPVLLCAWLKYDDILAISIIEIWNKVTLFIDQRTIPQQIVLYFAVHGGWFVHQRHDPGILLRSIGLGLGGFAGSLRRLLHRNTVNADSIEIQHIRQLAQISSIYFFALINSCIKVLGREVLEFDVAHAGSGILLIVSCDVIAGQIADRAIGGQKLLDLIRGRIGLQLCRVVPRISVPGAVQRQVHRLRKLQGKGQNGPFQVLAAVRCCSRRVEIVVCILVIIRGDGPLVGHSVELHIFEHTSVDGPRCQRCCRQHGQHQREGQDEGY